MRLPSWLSTLQSRYITTILIRRGVIPHSKNFRLSIDFTPPSFFPIIISWLEIFFLFCTQVTQVFS